MSRRSPSRRSRAEGRVLGLLALLALLAAALPSAALAADPSAGFDASWTVTRPDGVTVRDDASISVGDDLAMTFAAVDGTAVTRCQIAIATNGADVNVPGDATDGTCRLSMRLPAFPDHRWRDNLSPADSDICVFANLWYADDAERAILPEDHLEPGGVACGTAAAQAEDPPRLDFHVDDAGATPGRPFVSDPQFLSWDPADWGTGMEPFRFGQTWHVAIPDWVDHCQPQINGTWQTNITAQQPPACTDWDVRVPGILPEGIDVGSDPVWLTSLAMNYYQDGVEGPYSVVSWMAVPLLATDGVFESTLPSVFPMDLAKSRFVTVGSEWVPSYQVSGVEASLCRMQLYDHQGHDFAMYEIAPDTDDQCTFHVPALANDEWHQYHVTVVPESDPILNQTVFGGTITAIPEPAPPVIGAPTVETGGDTGLDVDPGAGSGLVVDLEVTPDATLAASSTTAAAPACAGKSISTDLASGGSIPTLEASCDLAPGAYTATATMIDAAGVASVAHRSFTVLAPRPTVAARSPGGGASGVARDVRPSVTFDEAVTGVSASSVRLAESSGTFVAGTVAYDTAAHKATFTPTTLLKAGRTYRLYLSNAIKGASSGRAIVATSWSFTTTSDATAPTILGRTPAAGSTGVARGVVPAVRFSEGVKGVTTTSLQLRDTVTGTYVPAVVRYDAAQHRATLDPTPLLAAGRTYLVIVRSSIRDLVGNPTTTATWSFKTGS